jgi:hypothetical protein
MRSTRRMPATSVPSTVRKAGEILLVQKRQDRAVDLVGPGEVFISRRDDGAVGVLQPVEPVLQPFHRDAAHVDDIAAHLAVVGGDERAHQVAVLEDQFGVLQHAGAPIIGEIGPGFGLVTAHGSASFVFFDLLAKGVARGNRAAGKGFWAGAGGGRARCAVRVTWGRAAGLSEIGPETDWRDDWTKS